RAETRALLVTLDEPIYARQIDRAREALESAASRGIGLVFLELHVPEGDPAHGIEVAEAIRDASGLRVVAFIRDKGYAAAVPIALACPEIVMKRGATLGNAGLDTDDEKRLSPLRARVSGYARSHGRPQRVAEAMVDPGLCVLEVKTSEGMRYFTPQEMQALTGEQQADARVQRTLVEQGRILTLSAEEAVAVGLARKVVAGRPELFELYELAPQQVEVFQGRKSRSPSESAQDAAAPSEAPPATRPQNLLSGKKVAIIPIRDDGNMVDMSLAGFVRRKVLEAKAEKVDVIVFEIETWGGRVDSADLITGYVSGADPIPTVALVTEKAVSAGALIAMSCKSIYMVKGTMIGSCLPIQIGQKYTGDPQDRKMVSAIRGQIKALAQKNGHPDRIAEKMVDPDPELLECRVDGQTRLFFDSEIEAEKRQAREEKHQFEVVRTLARRGEILNFTAEDAEHYGLSAATLPAESDLWPALQLTQPALLRYTMSWPERVARVIGSPYVCVPLMAIGFIALMIELVTPGFGIPGTVGLLCLGLGLWAQYIVGNANPYEILLFLLGFILIVIELLALPGFGVIGIVGIICVALSIFLAYVPDAYYYDPSFGERPWRITILNQALGAFAVIVLGSIGGLFLAARYLPNFRVFNRIAVTTELRTDVPGAPPDSVRVALIGKTAETITPLRPAGTARLDGELYDVTSDGDYIDSGQKVQIVRIEGNKIIVRPADGTRDG
ncbi:MAG: hypothetical protein HYU36_17605, partial [Planctomycetes bacterium]|nr:hypothetical protein [Planctomycetota bacterium]